MKTIGIEQSICTRYYFEHKFMNKLKKIYQHAGKCDDQQNLKDIIEVLRNHCVFSPTYWMLKQKQKNVVLWLKNPNVEP